MPGKLKWLSIPLNLARPGNIIRKKKLIVPPNLHKKYEYLNDSNIYKVLSYNPLVCEDIKTKSKQEFSTETLHIAGVKMSEGQEVKILSYSQYEVMEVD